MKKMGAPDADVIAAIDAKYGRAGGGHGHGHDHAGHDHHDGHAH